MAGSGGQSSLAERTYIGFLWQSVGLSLNTVLSLAHLMIMARLLTPEIFGQFAVIAIVIAGMTIVSEFGLGAALIQKKNLNDTDRRFVFLVNVSIALCFLLLTFQSGFLVEYFVLSIDPAIIQVLGVNVVIVSVGMASKATLQRQMRFNTVVFGTTLSYLLGTLIAGIFMAWLGYGIWALVLGLLVNNLILSVYFICRAPISLFIRESTVDSNSMLRYGGGLCLVQGINQLSRLSDKLILATMVTLGFVGLYERSQQIQQMPGVFLGGVFDNVLFPALSRLAQDRNALGGHFFQFCSAAALVSAYIAVSLHTFSSDLVSILLGERWMAAKAVLEILAMVTFFQILGRLSDTYVRASGIFSHSIVVKIVYLILVLLSALAGFRMAGSFGAIGGIIIAGVIHALMMLGICARHANYRYVELLKRMQPGVVLAVLVLIKNSALESVGFDNRLVFAAVVIASDILVCCFMYKSSLLMGEENRVYFKRRLIEIFVLIRQKVWLAL